MHPWLSPLWLVPEKKLDDWHFGLSRRLRKKFPGDFGTQYSEYRVLFLGELFAFASNAKTLQLPCLFFLFFLPVTDFVYILPFVTQDGVTRI